MESRWVSRGSKSSSAKHPWDLLAQKELFQPRGTMAQDEVPLDRPASGPETSEMEPQPEKAQQRMLGDTQAMCIGHKCSGCWMEGDVYFQTCSWIWR